MAQDVFVSGPPASPDQDSDRVRELVVCAAHPVDFFGQATADLLAATTQTRVVCVNLSAGLFRAHAHAEPCAGEDTEWVELTGVGQVFRRRGGPALLISPAPLDQAMKSAMPALYDFDSRGFIRTLHVPTLVLCGTADPVVPLRHARAAHAAIAGSTFVAIDGAGHVPTAEKRPEVASAFQAFVARLGGSPSAP